MPCFPPAGQAPALQPDEMPKHIAAIIATAVALSVTNTVIAQHSHHEHEIEQEQGREKMQKYTCPMHPEVITDHPGKCPKCGMKLVPLKEKKRGPSNAVKARGAHGALRAQRPTSNLSAVASAKEDHSHMSHAAGEHEHDYEHEHEQMHPPSHGSGVAGIEGKAARVAASERGQRASFNLY